MVTEGVEPCAYCGLPADSIDHIPSQCMRAKLIALGEYRGVWKEVPACRWCNSVLGRLALLTIDDRRQHIKASLRRKFKRLLKARIWSDEEIDEMGGGLRSYLRESKAKALEIRSRLAWAGQSRGFREDARQLLTQPEGKERPSRGIAAPSKASAYESNAQPGAERWVEQKYNFEQIWRLEHKCIQKDTLVSA